MRNVEIKARLKEEHWLRLLAQAQAHPELILNHFSLEQVDTFFPVPQGRLKLRQEKDQPPYLIAYARADEAGPKLSTYRTVSVPQPDNFLEALSLVGLHPLAQVKKTREVFLLRQPGHVLVTRLHLDRLDSGEHYLELEVLLEEEDTTVEQGQAEAQYWSDWLQVTFDQLVTHSYVDVILNQQ